MAAQAARFDVALRANLLAAAIRGASQQHDEIASMLNEYARLLRAVPELLEQIDRLTAGIAAYRKQRNSKDPGEDFAHTWEITQGDSVPT